MAKRPIVYLAAPYSHPAQAVRRRRFEQVTLAAARLAAEGQVVFSPITMTHPMDVALAKTGEALGSDDWVSFDESFMEHCAELIVLTLDGWDKSSGVQREIDFFRSRNRPVTFRPPDPPKKRIEALNAA